MSSPMPFKRRRLNDATAKLKKPFVSPMRSKQSHPPPTSSPFSDNADKTDRKLPIYVPSTLAHTVQASHTTSGPKEARSKLEKASTTTDHDPSQPQPGRGKNASPQEVAIRKAITALELQTRRAQNDIDVFKQAETLSNSTTDADLRELREKWRLASQCVAEELFGTVKERVCRMGGVAAWRDMERKKHDRNHGLGEYAEPAVEDDDADCEFDSQGEELPEAEQEYRRKLKRKARQEAMEAMDGVEQPASSTESETKIWEEPGKDDDTFTMDMMLRSLNIELSVIGYDQQTQKWT